MSFTSLKFLTKRGSPNPDYRDGSTSSEVAVGGILKLFSCAHPNGKLWEVVSIVNDPVEREFSTGLLAHCRPV